MFDRILNRSKTLSSFVKARRAASLAKEAFASSDIPPVLVFQMGKVGSTSVERTLSELELSNPVLHIHFLNTVDDQWERHVRAGIDPPPSHLFTGRAVRDQFALNPEFPALIISLVRDPIAREVSGFFQVPEFFSGDFELKAGLPDPKDLAKKINDYLSRPDALEYLDSWFDCEMKASFGIDVFERGFDREAGFDTYQAGDRKLLLLKLEELDRRGPGALSELLGIEVRKIERKNVGEKKQGGSPYSEALNAISLDEEVCRNIYSSRFAEHFYSSEEIEGFVRKWTRG